VYPVSCSESRSVLPFARVAGNLSCPMKSSGTKSSDDSSLEAQSPHRDEHTGCRLLAVACSLIISWELTYRPGSPNQEGIRLIALRWARVDNPQAAHQLGLTVVRVSAASSPNARG
jgi:hypothetical protein